jgi:hypothetical protein
MWVEFLQRRECCVTKSAFVDSNARRLESPTAGTSVSFRLDAPTVEIHHRRALDVALICHRSPENGAYLAGCHGAPDHVEWLRPSQPPSRPSLSQHSSCIAPSYQTIDHSLFQYRGISYSSVRESLVSPGPFTTPKSSLRHHDAPEHATGQSLKLEINEHSGATVSVFRSHPPVQPRDFLSRACSSASPRSRRLVNSNHICLRSITAFLPL